MTVTLNPSDTLNCTLSGGNLTATASLNVRGGARANISKSTGKWYFEWQAFFTGTPGGSSGNVSGGWASAEANKPLATTFWGGDTSSTGAYTDKTVYFNGSGPSYTPAIGSGDWNASCLDLDNAKEWVKNITQASGWNNTAIGSSDPAANLGGLSLAGITNKPWFPGCGFEPGTAAYSITFNFGASAFQSPPPTNFSALDTPAGAIPDAAVRSGPNAMTLFRERVSGLLEPVRDIWKPKRQRLPVPGFSF